MNPTLLARATKVVPETELLINMVRLRVRQLAGGARPLIAAAPGMGLCDLALSEIGEQKLTSERDSSAKSQTQGAAILNFPATAVTKKAA